MKADTFFEDLVNRCKEDVNCESVGLYVLDESNLGLTLVAAAGYPEKLIGAAQYRVGEGLTGWITRTGELLISNSPQQLESRFALANRYSGFLPSNLTHSLMACPLKGKSGKVIGVLKAENKKTAGHQFLDADVDTLKWFAESAAIALTLRRQNHQTQKPYVFVLMPFDKDFDDTYQYGIKKPIEDLGGECQRGNELQHSGNILEVVLESIRRARFIVADLSGGNPNVFYEVGYCHAIDKNVILCTRTADDIPFNLRGYSHIVYGGSISALDQALRQKISSLIDG